MHGDLRLIGVVLGAARAAERDRHMAMLLDAGFQRFSVPLSMAQAPVPTRPEGLLYATLTPPPPSAIPMREVPAEPSRQAARWSVSLGVYSSGPAARRAAVFARDVSDNGDVRVESMTRRRRTSYRALLVELTSPEARSVCVQMARRRRACALTHDGSNGDVASR